MTQNKDALEHLSDIGAKNALTNERLQDAVEQLNQSGVDWPVSIEVHTTLLYALRQALQERQAVDVEKIIADVKDAVKPPSDKEYVAIRKTIDHLAAQGMIGAGWRDVRIKEGKERSFTKDVSKAPSEPPPPPKPKPSEE